MSRFFSKRFVWIVSAAAAASYACSGPCGAATPDNQAAAQSDANTKNPAQRLTTPAVPSKASADDDERASSDAKAAAALKRRAGEKSAADHRGEALVLGMSLQEGPRESVKVVEVAPTSPAFDAGVRAGDQLLSYQGFRADSYRKWIDGIHRLTADTMAGAKIPVEVLRDGKRVVLGIRVPDRQVRFPAPKVLPQAGTPLGAPAPTGPQAVPVPAGPTTAPVAGGGSDVLFDNSSPFNAFFGNEAASPNERAMAKIVRLKMPQATEPTGPTGRGTAAGGSTTPISGDMKIGLAGFHDSPSGMVVMVDVGALAPGNYVVGISDSGSVGGATTGSAAPNAVANPQQQAVPQATPSGSNPTGNQVPQAPGAPAGGAPASSTPAGNGQPQGNAAPEFQSIPRSVLAQVGDPSGPVNNQLNGGAAPGAAANAQQAANATGQSTAQGQPAQSSAAGGPVNTSTPRADSGVSGATLNEIGTLTVDQSGTGRMQQTVEGVQVRNVVGQSIVIYSQGGSQTSIPPNAGAGAAARQGVVDATSAQGSQGIVRASDVAQASGGRVPIAAGVIRLMSDRRPPPSTANGTSPTAPGVNPNPVVDQPQPGPQTATPGANPITR